MGELEGTHHGNALMASVGVAVLDTVVEHGFLEQVRNAGFSLARASPVWLIATTTANCAAMA